MKFSEYIAYWESERWTSVECKYLKDWHFYRDSRDTNDVGSVYSTPELFCSDWLNEWWQGRRGGENDYRFVYIGPKGSWTPLHSDVFSSYRYVTMCTNYRVSQKRPHISTDSNIFLDTGYH